MAPSADYDYWELNLLAGDFHARIVPYPVQTAAVQAGLFAANGQQIETLLNEQGPGVYEILNFTISDEVAHGEIC